VTGEAATGSSVVAHDDARDDRLAYLGAGPLLAVVLGFALVPLRETVGASNLGFAFVVLTVVISAFGGRAAGVTTALASALSMDFFLTRPYLTLQIASTHDIIAFAGLTITGLVAASLGSPDRIAALRELRGHVQVLHAALRELEGGGPADAELGRVLESARHALPVSGLAVRDLHDHVVAVAPPKYGLEPIPAEAVEADTLLPRGLRVPRRPPPLPAAGARVAIVTRNRQVGWLDLWGDGTPASAADRRTLSDVARLAGLMLARDAPP